MTLYKILNKKFKKFINLILKGNNYTATELNYQTKKWFRTIIYQITAKYTWYINKKIKSKIYMY